MTFRRRKTTAHDAIAENSAYLGMLAPHRGKDLVDVQELIRSAGLKREVAGELHPWVRDRFLALWDLAQVADPF